LARFVLALRVFAATEADLHRSRSAPGSKAGVSEPLNLAPITL